MGSRDVGKKAGSAVVGDVVRTDADRHRLPVDDGQCRGVRRLAEQQIVEPVVAVHEAPPAVLLGPVGDRRRPHRIGRASMDRRGRRRQRRRRDEYRSTKPGVSNSNICERSAVWSAARDPPSHSSSAPLGTRPQVGACSPTAWSIARPAASKIGTPQLVTRASRPDVLHQQDEVVRRRLPLEHIHRRRPDGHEVLKIAVEADLLDVGVQVHGGGSADLARRRELADDRVG